jgi:hypothetical protein
VPALSNALGKDLTSNLRHLSASKLLIPNGGAMAKNGNPFAVVTGASSGIGYELARVFGQNGFQALMDGKDHVFAASLKTKVEGEVSKIVPASVTAEMHRKQAERKKG